MESELADEVCDSYSEVNALPGYFANRCDIHSICDSLPYLHSEDISNRL